jgi:hypothetical protein
MIAPASEATNERFMSGRILTLPLRVVEQFIKRIHLKGLTISEISKTTLKLFIVPSRKLVIRPGDGARFQCVNFVLASGRCELR